MALLLLVLATACDRYATLQPAAGMGHNVAQAVVLPLLAGVQCLPNVNGLYPVLQGTFDKFIACRNGTTVGRIRTCAANTLFSFGWQSCIAERFMVAFDERECAALPAVQTSQAVPMSLAAITSVTRQQKKFCCSNVSFAQCLYCPWHGMLEANYGHIISLQ